VSITTKPSFAFGPASTLSSAGSNTNPLTLPRQIDITRDGKFVLPVFADQRQTGTLATPQIQVVLNWFRELQERVPVK
jgi:hypothetical protein